MATFLVIVSITLGNSRSRNKGRCCHRAGLHDLGNLDDIIKGDAAIVLNVLGLLSVTLGLLQGLDDERGGRRHGGHLRLAVLDGELDGHAKDILVPGDFLCDILANFLRGQDERTNLGSERTGCSDLATSDPDEHVHYLSRKKKNPVASVATIAEEIFNAGVPLSSDVGASALGASLAVDPKASGGLDLLVAFEVAAGDLLFFGDGADFGKDALGAGEGEESAATSPATRKMRARTNTWRAIFECTIFNLI
ncbi:60S ribosomal protein L12-like [Forsythia ovata]|uniref:60S ribosomal protein L12-like n=1 Tax=Forsythia ovata TaxID=205694 RepID=A0ABD1UVG2_9LAMI